MDPVMPPDQVDEHAMTYHRFMLAVKWCGIHAAALIAFLVLWFATPAGFVGGLTVGLVIFAAGVYAMRHGLAHSSESEVSAVADQR
jgi:hypothetical protein